MTFNSSRGRQRKPWNSRGKPRKPWNSKGRPKKLPSTKNLFTVEKNHENQEKNDIQVQLFKSKTKKITMQLRFAILGFEFWPFQQQTAVIGRRQAAGVHQLVVAWLVWPAFSVVGGQVGWIGLSFRVLGIEWVNSETGKGKRKLAFGFIANCKQESCVLFNWHLATFF